MGCALKYQDWELGEENKDETTQRICLTGCRRDTSHCGGRSMDLTAWRAQSS
jgi:hypothetical protein